MKAHSNKRTLWLSAGSLLIAALFLLMAGGSILDSLLDNFYLPKIRRLPLEDGRIAERSTYQDNLSSSAKNWEFIKTGYQVDGVWEGDFIQEYYEFDTTGVRKFRYKEEVRMVDGYPPVSYTHLTLPTTPYV
jgi:hypothetical protein